jgi:hypothetical protein
MWQDSPKPKPKPKDCIEWWAQHIPIETMGNVLKALSCIDVVTDKNGF